MKIKITDLDYSFGVIYIKKIGLKYNNDIFLSSITQKLNDNIINDGYILDYVNIDDLGYLVISFLNLEDDIIKIKKIELLIVKIINNLLKKYFMKENYINIIEGLFPADSEYSDTAEKGIELMLKAMSVTYFDWRKLPEDVLKIYSELCLIEDI